MPVENIAMISEVLCQLGGKENNSNENEQRTEQIGEIGDKVHVVFKDDLIPGSFMLHQFVHLFVEIEYHCNRNDQCNSKYVCPQELLDDIPVQPFYKSIAFHFL